MFDLQTDFFAGFAHGGIERIGIAGFDAAARKADLSGMMAQVLRTLGQQHMQAIGARHQTAQY